jgi:hypothetical protein
VWGNLSAEEKAQLTSWQRLALEHADDLLSDISAAERQPLVAVIEAAARAAEAGDRARGGALRWQYGGGTARGKDGGHDLDFIFTREGEEGSEEGMLERMLTALAASDDMERDESGRARMAVVLAYGAGGDASGDTVAQNRSSWAKGEHFWTPGAKFEDRDDGEPARKALMLLKVRLRARVLQV